MSRVRQGGICVVLCLALLLTGCGEKTESSRADAATGPITKEECDALGEQIQQLVREGADGKFRLLMDLDGMIGRAMDIGGLSEVQRKGFRRGVMQEWRGPAGLCGQIVAVTQNGGSYVFLRSHQVDGEWRVLIRLLLGEGGANYHDMIIKRGPSDELRVADIYVLLSGETMSQTLRRGVVQMLAAQPGGLIGRLAGWESDYAQNAGNIQKMAQYLRMGQPAETMKVYDALPDSLKQDKSLLILRLQAAQRLGDDAYLAAISDFQEHHPDDAGLDLISVDGLIMRHEHQKALAAVDRLELRLGGDPYLSVLRGNILWMAKDLAAARAHVLEAIQAEPGLEMAYWTMVTITLDQKNHAETILYLNALKEQFGAQFLGIEQEPIYADFVKSESYKAWINPGT